MYSFAPQDLSPRPCQYCDTIITDVRVWHKAYCDDACRQAARREHLSQEQAIGIA